MLRQCSHREVHTSKPSRRLSTGDVCTEWSTTAVSKGDIGRREEGLCVPHRAEAFLCCPPITTEAGPVASGAVLRPQEWQRPVEREGEERWEERGPDPDSGLSRNCFQSSSSLLGETEVESEAEVRRRGREEEYGWTCRPIEAAATYMCRGKEGLFQTLQVSW